MKLHLGSLIVGSIATLTGLVMMAAGSKIVRLENEIQELKREGSIEKEIN